ncbi:MAG: hypothetical protein V3U57_00270 [Robiginitomaculum sp.]
MTNTDFIPASNADVIRRFGRRFIMGRAWFSFKHYRGFSAPKNFAEALRSAWRSFRCQIDRERQETVRVTKLKTAYTGDRNSRSPLNPYRKSRFPEWGKHGNREYYVTIAGRWSHVGIRY